MCSHHWFHVCRTSKHALRNLHLDMKAFPVIVSRHVRFCRPRENGTEPKSEGPRGSYPRTSSTFICRGKSHRKPKRRRKTNRETVRHELFFFFKWHRIEDEVIFTGKEKRWSVKRKLVFQQKIAHRFFSFFFCIFKWFILSKSVGICSQPQHGRWTTHFTIRDEKIDPKIETGFKFWV